MDVSFLRPLYERPGPYASLYADLTRTTEEVPKAPELRWRALREDLAAQDIAAETRRAVADAVERELDRHWSGGLAVFAAHGEVVLAERLPAAPRRPFAHVAPLPHVLPLLAQRGEQVPHLVAVVDRTGAEVSGVSADGRRVGFDVRGDADYPLRKVSAGDWNQSRFQRAAEENWRSNAKKVGREVEQAARRYAPEVVVIAGDVRARTAVMEELPAPLLERAAETTESADHADAEIGRLVELKAAEHVMAAVARFEEERAHRGREAEGLGPVAAALRRGQVGTLLLADNADAEDRLWIGPEPGHVATSPDELSELGVAEPATDRADAALVRALVATDGDLLVTPPDGLDAESRVAALLRYVDESTPH
ncbi:MAG TPA: Vms1/Ankzf1 family peptidyl-tRNA hydrolase [Streptosporangiaceae bacterium]|nr:Vms1/Ankzf1 family peptidyl-tRNA hydrolase [Streptosporangiaceae bacterium]